MPRDFPPDLRPLARRGARAIFLSAALSLLGCSDGTGPGATFTLSKMRWEQREPPLYRYTLQRSCYCMDEVTMPVIIAVENGVVISRRYEWSNAEVASRFIDAFPAIDGLFDIIEDAIEADAYHLRVRYDRTYGYPTLIDLNYDKEMVDDEVTYTIRDFTLLSDPGAASSRH